MNKFSQRLEKCIQFSEALFKKPLKGLTRTSDTIHWVEERNELLVEIREASGTMTLFREYESLPKEAQTLVDEAKKAGYNVGFASFGDSRDSEFNSIYAHKL